MSIRVVILFFIVSLMVSSSEVLAQGTITTIALSPDQIGTVRTAQAITTKISFPERVIEVICGDLYDTASGKGTFVVQSSGNDVFLKPIASKGMSNMFVKTGEQGKYSYNFDLIVVPIQQAHRVVNVTWVPPAAQSPSQGGDRKARDPQNEPTTQNNPPGPNNGLDQRKNTVDLMAARAQADEILRNARQQADRITAEAEAKNIELERQTTARGALEAERRFVQSLLLGLREVKINNPRATGKRFVVTLEPRVITFDEKSYLRYTIQNTGDKEFAFSAVTIEEGAGKETQPVEIEVIQSKTENKLAPDESLSGVVSFDGKIIASKDKLTFFIRGEENAEIARITIK